MYNLFVVYYINCDINNNYFDWLSNQINYVINLGATIYITATISKVNEEYFRTQVKNLFPNEKIIIQCNYENDYEYPGILKVWEIGQEHYGKEDIILYFHSSRLLMKRDKSRTEDSQIQCLFRLCYLQRILRMKSSSL
jgi:hypothetical protein